MSENIPAGWKLVPIDPTDAMIDAGRLARMNVAGGYEGPSGWQAMLDAVPPAPTHISVGSQAVAIEALKKIEAAAFGGYLSPDLCAEIVTAALSAEEGSDNGN